MARVLAVVVAAAGIAGLTGCYRPARCQSDADCSGPRLCSGAWGFCRPRLRELTRRCRFIQAGEDPGLPLPEGVTCPAPKSDTGPGPVPGTDSGPAPDRSLPPHRSCPDGCYVDGFCHRAGATRTSLACDVCDPRHDPRAWTRHVCVTTFAGSGVAGHRDGVGLAARFSFPRALAIWGKTLYVGEAGQDWIRAVDLRTRSVFSVAGGATAGLRDGVGAAARFDGPGGLLVSGRTLYVADTGNGAIRTVDLPTRTVATFAGGRGKGHRDATGTAARFVAPVGLALRRGVLYVTDQGDHRIRAIDLKTRAVTTVAGTGVRGFWDDRLEAARFAAPAGIEASGNVLYVADPGNHRIRVVDLVARVVLTLAGSGVAGHHNAKAADARFWVPSDLALAGTRLLVTDGAGLRLRLVDLITRNVATVAGSGDGFSRDGPGLKASFVRLRGLVLSGKVVYVADEGAHTIRVVRLPW